MITEDQLERLCRDWFWDQGWKLVEGPNGRRKLAWKKFTLIRILRFRVAHHEPILYWNPPRHHENMIQLCEWIGPKPLPDSEDTAGLQKFRVFGYPWPLARSLIICPCSDLMNSTTNLA